MNRELLTIQESQQAESKQNKQVGRTVILPIKSVLSDYETMDSDF